MRRNIVRTGVTGLALVLLTSCGSGGRGGAIEECDPSFATDEPATESMAADALAFGNDYGYIRDPEAVHGLTHLWYDSVNVPGEVICLNESDDLVFTTSGLAVYRQAVQNPDSGISDREIG